MPTDFSISHALIHIGYTIGWTSLGLALLYIGMRVFDMLDPIDHRAELLKGNMAVAIQIGSMTLALAAVVVASIVT